MKSVDPILGEDEAQKSEPNSSKHGVLEPTEPSVRAQIVSYAQNFEDVILWRALKHINSGFYIDIGAHDPVVYSVSRAFYENGWRGVHVEPVPAYAAALRQDRPDEIVVEAAIAPHRGQLKFYAIDGTGLSTTDAVAADAHSSSGYKVQTITANAVPLSEILDRWAGREIHWLKIDVEGMEGEAIASWSPSTVRPWIVVVEATEPNSETPSHRAWEPTLEELGYSFVYFDGLNRFYVHQAHMDLAHNFGPGPNVFDDFVYKTDSAPHFATILVHQVRDLSDLCRSQGAEIQRLRSELRSLYNSNSWKITGWLRAAETARRGVLRRLRLD